jgi:hypothetical protein
MAKQEMGPQESDKENLENQLPVQEKTDEPLIGAEQMEDLQKRADAERAEENRNPEKIEELKKGINLDAAEYHRERARQAGLSENATELDVSIAELETYIAKLEKDYNNETNQYLKADIGVFINSNKGDLWEKKEKRAMEIKKQKELEALETRKRYIAENFSSMPEEERRKLTSEELKDYWTPERIAANSAENARKVAERERLWMEGEEKRKREKEESKSKKGWFKRLFGG